MCSLFPLWGKWGAAGPEQGTHVHDCVQHSIMAVTVEFCRDSEAQGRGILRSVPNSVGLVSFDMILRMSELMVESNLSRQCEENNLIRQMREILMYVWQALRLLKRKFNKHKWYTADRFLRIYTCSSQNNMPALSVWGLPFSHIAKEFDGCLLPGNHGIIEHVLKLFPVILKVDKRKNTCSSCEQSPCLQGGTCGPQVSPTEQLFWVALLVSPEHHPLSPSAKQCKRSHWPVLRGAYEELRREWNSYFKTQV